MQTKRKWRKTSQIVSGRRYWSLQAGSRGDGRVALALGHVTQAEAERAVEVMQREEDTLFGSPLYDRVLRLYAGDVVSASDLDGPAPRERDPRKGRDQARRFLIGDPTVDEVFGTANVAPNYRSMSVRDYYATVYAPWRKAARPRSWRVEAGDWKRVLDGIGDVRLRDVDEYVVDDFLTGLKKLSGEDATWNMKRRCRNAIAAMLTYARRRKHDTRPMPQWFKLEGSTERTWGRQSALTLDELKALLAACGPQLRAIVAAGAGLGLRPSEITSLRWEQFDWSTGEVHVRGSKTIGSDAVVPILPIALAVLTEWHAACGSPTSGTLFKPTTAKPGQTEYKVRSGHVPFRKALGTAVRKSGIRKRVTPYTLRHTAATLLVEAGTPIDSVAKLLRHTSPQMVRKHYDHSGATRAPGLRDLAPRLS